MKAQNHALNFLKIFFLTIIIVMHSAAAYKYLMHGYLGVDFFFMTSGYFLYKTYIKNSSMSLLAYTKRRICKLYPHYILSLGVMAIMFQVFHSPNAKKFVDTIPEILMIHNIGIFPPGGINYPSWYVSVLVVASILIFAFFKLSSKAVRITVSTIIATAIYAYIFAEYSSLEAFPPPMLFFPPFWRGVAGMLFGGLAYELQSVLSKRFFDKNILLTNIIEGVSFFGITALLFIKGNVLDLVIAFLIFVLIVAVSSPHSIMNRLSDNAVLKWLMKYEYAIYLNHAFMLAVTRSIRPHYLRVIITLACTVVYSIFTTKFIDMVTDKTKALIARFRKKA